ncbi:leucine-rich repeat protein [Lachnospiraceae bacterium CLA-AA-H215]|uniref:Leucine-rich repeat protein n=1 Tax=Hominifimenecus microfluidus TaxID=2885348 RepID=A0AAE3ECU8_9FIRM|nr:leucine-rich repeat protein [Hominifimenecus microfluidus]MCC2232287.1 leucine-rich repeat protein [Hominifimenecus microfluidus]
MVKKRILSLGIIASMLLGTVTPALANSRLAEPQSYEREADVSAISQSEEAEETTSTYQQEENAEASSVAEDTLETESKEETYENDLSQASSAEEGVKENSPADTTAESSKANEAKQEETIPAQEIMPTEESKASEETIPVSTEIVDESILEARTEMLSAADSETPGKYDSYDQFLAYYYLTYSPLDYYMDTAELPYQTYVKNVDDDFKTKLQAWRLATLDGKSAVEYSTKEVEFYELLIFDILYQDIAEDQILKNAETGVKTLEAAVQKDIAGVVYDWTLETELTADNASEIVDRLVKCGDLEFLGDCVDILKKGVEYTKTVEELIEKLYMLKQLNSCSEEIAAVLKDLYNNSTDKQMKEGCRQVALVATGMMTESEILAVFSGQVVLEEIAKYAVDKVWDGILKSTSLGKMIAIGQATGKLVANVLFSTDEIVENWYSMEQVCKFEEVLKARLKVYQNRFLSNPTCDNAKLFNAAADMYLSTQSVGMEYAKKYVEAVNGSGALGLIYKNFTHKDEYNELIRQLDSIKSSIDQAIEFANNETQNFYQEDMKAMGYLDTPVEKTPCSVTKEDVDKSVANVPDDLLKLTNQYVSEDTSYTEDKETYANYYMDGGTLDLAGRTLTVYGDFYFDGGTINIHGGTLDIRGDLHMSRGRLYLNGGTVSVGGDAYFADINEDGNYRSMYYRDGILEMSNESDRLIIAGSIITFFYGYSGYFKCSAGILEIGGNWTDYTSLGVRGSGSFKTVFTGSQDFAINGLGNSKDTGKLYVPVLEIENASSRKVSVQGTVQAGTVSGGDLAIVAQKTPTIGFEKTTDNIVVDGSVNLTSTKLGKNMTIKGDCDISDVTLNGNTLEISGNLNMSSGKLYLNGGQLIVGQNAYFTDINEDGNYTSMYTSGILQMNNESDQMVVVGDLVTFFYYGSNFKCSAGTLEIGGSWTDYTSLAATGNFKVVFIGSQNFAVKGMGNSQDSGKIYVPILEVQNSSVRTVSMQGRVTAGTLLGEMITITAQKTPIIGFEKTTDNVTINGNIQLISTKLGKNIKVNGDCDISDVTLNGNTLEISGNLNMSSGKLYLNGGKLIVGQNAYFTDINEDGKYTSMYSNGILQMNNESDQMVVAGDLVTFFYSGSNFKCTAGTLEIGGSWTDYGSVGSSGSFKTIFTGTQDFTIKGSIVVPTLEIQNASTRKVSMQGRIEVGTLLGGAVTITAQKTPTLSFGTTTDSIVVNGNVKLGTTKLSEKLVIQGDCLVVGTVTLNENELDITGDLNMVSGMLYLKGGKLKVEKNAYLAGIDEDGNYTSMSGYSSDYGNIKMNEETDRFIVAGDLVTFFYSGCQCSEGTIEIGGNWTDYGGGTWSEGVKVVFTGTQDIAIKRIDRGSYNSYIYVSTLEIQNASSRKVSMQGRIEAKTLSGGDVNIVALDTPDLSFGTTTGKVNISGDVALAIPTKSGGDVSVDGDLYLFSTVRAGAYAVSVSKDFYVNVNNSFILGPSGALNVDGDVWINNGTLSLGGRTYISGDVYQTAGTLSVGSGLVKIAGDYRIQKPDESTGEFLWAISDGQLYMRDDGGRMAVGGDFYMQSRYTPSLYAGVLAIMGDFHQISEFKPTGTHTVILGGAGRQTVEFASSTSRFNILQLTKSRTLYTFNPDSCWVTLEERKTLPDELKFEESPKILASGYCGDNISWTLSVDGIMNFSGKGAMRNYSSATVTSWYEYRDKIVSIILDDGITSIGNFAFAGLPNLVTIDIPEGVALIDGYAFKNSTALRQVTLPSTLKKLGESAFFGCSSLESIAIPEGIYTVWGYTFKNCTSLKTVELPSTLIKLDEAAFYGCENLEEIVIPDNVSIIGAYCFKNCSKLQRITLPANLLQIREASFYGTAVKELVIPDNVSLIGKYAFKNCTKLQSVVMPDALRKIDDSAFYACSKLTELSLPKNLTSICAYAFRKCTGLQSVSFPEGLNLIGESSFYGCTALRELVIPQGVTVIDSYAFKGCENVASVSLPSTLERMGESAFYGCTLLTQITIPESVAEIGDYAFSRCSYLITVVFNGDMPLIGANSFKSVTADCYYLAGNKTWTEEGRTSYGGELTWQAYTGSMESNSEANPEDAAA